MGYACPVCDTPQRDGEHLAHHLAFTAMIHGDDHEAWLDEHAPGWGGMDPEGLAEAVVPHAEDATYHETFEDTVDRGRPGVDAGGHVGHGHDSHGSGEHGHDSRGRDGRGRGTGSGDGGQGLGVDDAGTDPETAAVLREARALTREMYDDEDGEEDGQDDSSDDSDHELGADDSASDSDGSGGNDRSDGSDGSGGSDGDDRSDPADA